MKLCKCVLAGALGLAMLVGAGCNKNSSEQAGTTNSAAAMMPSTNGMTANPPAGMTNGSTNMPAMPNK